MLVIEDIIKLPQLSFMFQVYRQCKENVWLEDSNAKPVGIELYIESLCPDCKNFITDQLSPAFRNVLPIMNLTIIPYGNAMVNLKAGERVWNEKNANIY